MPEARRCGDMLTNQTSPRLRVFTQDRAAISTANATPANLNSNAAARLTRLLFAKSLLEVLFVVALAAAFHFVAFNPRLRGSLDRADARQVAGWTLDESDPSARVEVQLYIDGNFAASNRADRPRPDVRAAGRAADDLHGFVFDTPALPAGEREARVYAVHASGDNARRTLTLVGHPLRFQVEANREGASRR